MDCSSELDSAYDLPMHIAAVFIIGASSLLGTIIPIVAIYFNLFQVDKKSFNSN